jgi:hypothetical protein
MLQKQLDRVCRNSPNTGQPVRVADADYNEL